MDTTVTRIVTYNYGDTGQPGDLDKLAKYADTIACQEMADRYRTAITPFLRGHPGWAVYHGSQRGAKADPILVNVDKLGPVTVIDHPGLKGRYLGPRGNGPIRAKPKPVTEFRFSDLSMFNLHTMPSVTKTKEELGEAEWLRRRKHHADFLAAVLAATPDDGEVAIVGDLNSDKRLDLNGVLSDYEGWTTVATFGSRSIDHILNRKTPDTTGNAAVTVSGTHSDHRPVLRTLTTEENDMPPLLEPTYAGPAKYHGGPTNKPINRLVIHMTVSPCEPGMAAKIARYFRTTVTRPSSAHYVIDPDESLQVVYDSYVAYHAPPNERSLGFEFCGYPTREPEGQWKKPLQHRMIVRGARLVAEACVVYDVPPVKLSVQDLKDGKRGICGHDDISGAFHQTSHWDPGEFPWDGFMKKVQREVDAIKAERQKARK